MKFLFTCGGTAGHINPALAVAGRIKELLPDSEILFVGAEGNMETELVPREGFEIATVTITNLRRSMSPEAISHNLKTLTNIPRSLSQARRIIKDFQPDVAIGTGGYVCYPVLRAASGLKIPTALHESNAVPGLTTKLLAPIVDKVMVGFEDSKNYYKNPEKVVVTGTPVRGDFVRIDKAQAKAELGLPQNKPLVVSVWGSLGASHMNSIMVSFIERACAKPFFTLIHSAGKRGFVEMREELARQGVAEYQKKGIDVREYIYDMPRVMAAADLVLCRAGASTLSELAVLGKPAVLIPSPNVTNNHQEKNARALEKAGAAKVLLEGEFNADSLMGIVSELLNQPEKLESMSREMLKLGIPDATDRIVDIVLSLSKG
ncbi:MAG: undecaprenyldiphospho-muramoylpentapeptide beta-N-acetylglucosaminyltransferase [Oscillospiraceae bacterium]|jgi:UDP-N-acetylglucosamine--N-acetylmuramyl-(pentapeptide) pyrophosphoryl-undecaprenol N-acetylglucosamine transferase